MECVEVAHRDVSTIFGVVPAPSPESGTTSDTSSTPSHSKK